MIYESGFIPNNFKFDIHIGQLSCRVSRGQASYQSKTYFEEARNFVIQTQRDNIVNKY